MSFASYVFIFKSSNLLAFNKPERRHIWKEKKQLLDDQQNFYH